MSGLPRDLARPSGSARVGMWVGVGVGAVLLALDLALLVYGLNLLI